MTRSSVLAVIPITACALTLVSCGEAPQVVQGTVVAYDPSTSTLILRDECPPHGEITLSLEDAEIGAEPESNDVVRAAFRTEGDRHKALRVMNLTRQKEIGMATDTRASRCPPVQK